MSNLSTFDKRFNLILLDAKNYSDSYESYLGYEFEKLLADSKSTFLKDSFYHLLKDTNLNVKLNLFQTKYEMFYSLFTEYDYLAEEDLGLSELKAFVFQAKRIRSVQEMNLLLGFLRLAEIEDIQQLNYALNIELFERSKDIVNEYIKCFADEYNIDVDKFKPLAMFTNCELIDIGLFDLTNISNNQMAYTMVNILLNYNKIENNDFRKMKINSDKMLRKVLSITTKYLFDINLDLFE